MKFAWLGCFAVGCLAAGPPDDFVPVCGDGVVEAEGCDDGNRVSGDGCSADCHGEFKQVFRWGVATVANPNQVQRCVAGAHIAVIAIEACLNEPCPEQIEADCAAGEFSRFELNPPLFYTTQIRIEDAVTRELYGDSPLFNHTPVSEREPRQVIYEDAGTLQLTVVMMHGGQGTTCFDQEINAVELILTPRTGGQPINVTMPCQSAFDHGAEYFVAPPLSPGVYGVRLQAEGASTTLSDVTIEARHNKFLGVVSLEFP